MFRLLNKIVTDSYRGSALRCISK